MNKVGIVVASCLAGAAIAVLVTYLRSRTEHLAYLSTYDQQDHYKNRFGEGVPSWPVVNTATTSFANIERDQIAKDKAWYDAHPDELYSNLECI